MDYEKKIAELRVESRGWRGGFLVTFMLWAASVAIGLVVTTGLREDDAALTSRISECRKEQLPVLDRLTKAEHAAAVCETVVKPCPAQVCPEAPVCPECPQAPVLISEELGRVYAECIPRVRELKNEEYRLRQELEKALAALRSKGWARDGSEWLRNPEALVLFQQLDGLRVPYEEALQERRRAADVCVSKFYDVLARVPEFEQVRALAQYEGDQAAIDMADALPEWWQDDAWSCSNFCSSTGRCRIRRPPVSQATGDGR